MNFMQVISSHMTTWQAVIFWIFVFMFFLTSILACIGFYVDKKEADDNAKKTIRALQKENSELAAKNDLLRSMYREEKEKSLVQR